MATWSARVCILDRDTRGHIWSFGVFRDPICEGGQCVNAKQQTSLLPKAREHPWKTSKLWLCIITNYKNEKYVFTTPFPHFSFSLSQSSVPTYTMNVAHSTFCFSNSSTFALFNAMPFYFVNTFPQVFTFQESIPSQVRLNILTPCHCYSWFTHGLRLLDISTNTMLLTLFYLLSHWKCLPEIPENDSLNLPKWWTKNKWNNFHFDHLGSRSKWAWYTGGNIESE